MRREACLTEESSPLLLGWQRPRPGKHPLQLGSCHVGEPLSAQCIRISLQCLLLCAEDPVCLPESALLLTDQADDTLCSCAWCALDGSLTREENH